MYVCKERVGGKGEGRIIEGWNLHLTIWKPVVELKYVLKFELLVVSTGLAEGRFSRDIE